MHKIKMNTKLKDRMHKKETSLLVNIAKILDNNVIVFRNKKGISLPIERLGFWIFILLTMILILIGLGMYVFPKFGQMIPKLFG